MTYPHIKTLLNIIDLPVMHMTLKKEWFDMIAKGEKKEEYRAFKGRWRSLFSHAQYVTSRQAKHMGVEPGLHVVSVSIKGVPHSPETIAILFSNGYSPDSRKMLVTVQGIRLDKGRPEWGAPKEKCFIISLGDVIPLNFEI